MLAIHKICGPPLGTGVTGLLEAVDLVSMVIRKCGMPPAGVIISVRHCDPAVVLVYDSNDAGAVEYVKKVAATPLCRWDRKAVSFLRRMRRRRRLQR